MSDPDSHPHIQPVTTPKGRRKLWGNAIKDIPPPQPLVQSSKGLIDRATTVEMYGGWGQYKSFLACDLGFCVATGTPFFGHKVHQGNVLYLVGEGFVGTGVRLEAWQEYHGITMDPPICWVEGIPNLVTNPTELLAIVKDVNPVLTVIDTLARGIAGLVENNNDIMSMVIQRIDEIKEVNDGTPLVVHHSGRTPVDDHGNLIGQHSRGGSALDAGLDTVLKMQGKELYVEKQRHHEDHYTWGKFEVIPVCDSVVLELQGAPSNLTPNMEQILAALEAVGREAPNGVLKHAAAARGCKESSFDATLTSLVKRKLVVKDASVASKPIYRLA